MRALLLTLLLSGGDYDGRFAGHPSFRALSDGVFSASQSLGKKLPDWISKRAPEVRVKLVDLERPVAAPCWPGDVDASFAFERKGKDGLLKIELPIDPLIERPHLARLALARQLFCSASFVRAMDEGVEIAALESWGAKNPLIEALAAHWAGSLDDEIEFVLRRHLASDEALRSLLRPVEPVPGSLTLARAGADDLTPLLLVRMLAPEEKDSKLKTLYAALENGQPLQDALEKASKLPLERLNRKLEEFYEKYLEERFPAKVRPKYRLALEAVGDESWEEVVDLVPALEGPFLAPRTAFLVAQAMEGLAKEPGAEVAQLYANVLTWYEQSDLGSEAMRRCARVLRAAGDEEQARRAYERLRDAYGWLPGVQDEVKAALE